MVVLFFSNNIHDGGKYDENFMSLFIEFESEILCHLIRLAAVDVEVWKHVCVRKALTEENLNR